MKSQITLSAQNLLTLLWMLIDRNVVVITGINGTLGRGGSCDVEMSFRFLDKF